MFFLSEEKFAVEEFDKKKSQNEPRAALADRL